MNVCIVLLGRVLGVNKNVLGKYGRSWVCNQGVCGTGNTHYFFSTFWTEHVSFFACNFSTTSTRTLVQKEQMRPLYINIVVPVWRDEGTHFVIDLVHQWLLGYFQRWIGHVPLNRIKCFHMSERAHFLDASTMMINQYERNDCHSMR